MSYILFSKFGFQQKGQGQNDRAHKKYSIPPSFLHWLFIFLKMSCGVSRKKTKFSTSTLRPCLLVTKKKNTNQNQNTKKGIQPMTIGIFYNIVSFLCVYVFVLELPPFQNFFSSLASAVSHTIQMSHRTTTKKVFFSNIYFVLYEKE